MIIAPICFILTFPLHPLAQLLAVDNGGALKLICDLIPSPEADVRRATAWAVSAFAEDAALCAKLCDFG